MKTLTVRELNRRMAGILDAVERSETFELRRNGKTIAYLSHTAPSPEKKPNWNAHFDWLKRQGNSSIDFVKELEEDRRRLRARTGDGGDSNDVLPTRALLSGSKILQPHAGQFRL